MPVHSLAPCFGRSWWDIFSPSVQLHLWWPKWRGGRMETTNVSFISFFDHLFLHLHSSRKLNSSLITSPALLGLKRPGSLPLLWTGCELYVLNLWIRLRLPCLPLSVSCKVELTRDSFAVPCVPRWRTKSSFCGFLLFQDWQCTALILVKQLTIKFMLLTMLQTLN